MVHKTYYLYYFLFSLFLLLVSFSISFVPDIFAAQTTSDTVEVSRNCPELVQPNPLSCVDGTYIDGGDDKNGCPKPPVCIKSTTNSCPVNCTCQGSVIVCPSTSNNETIEEKVVISSDFDVCPVNCICTGSNKTCKTQVEESTTPGGNSTCPGNCTCKEGMPVICRSNPDNQPTANETTPEETSVCPVGCICHDVVSVCPSGNNPVSTTIEVDNSPIKVVISSDSSGQTKMTIPKSDLEVSGNISIRDNMLLTGTSENSRQIIFPTELEQVLQDVSIKRITLLEPNENTPFPRYRINKTHKGKLLYVIPVQYQVTQLINAETGQGTSEESPFWSFLVKTD